MLTLQSFFFSVFFLFFVALLSQLAGPSIAGLPSTYGNAASARRITTDRSEVTQITNDAVQCAAIATRLTAGIAAGTSWIESLVTKESVLDAFDPSRYETELGTTSLNMSYYLLETYNQRRNRWGAMVCNDLIPTDVAVDWAAVVDLIPPTLNLLASSPAASTAAEQALVSGSPYSVGPAEATVADIQAACAVLVTDSSSAFFAPCTAVDILAFDLEGGITTQEAAFAILNATATGGGGSVLFSFLIDALTNSSAAADDDGAVALETFLLASGLFPNGTLAAVGLTNGTNTVTLPRADVGVSGVKVADDGSNVVFRGVVVEVVSTNTYLNVGNVTLTAEQLQGIVEAVFGNDTIHYTFKTPAPMSILHNTSSFHALWMFGGLVRQEEYREQCLDPDMWSTRANDDSIAAVADDAATVFADDDGVSSDGGKRRSPGRFVVRNHPLPLTTRQTLEIRTILSFFASLFVLIALSYAPAAFVTFVVKERACKSLHLQKVNI